MTDKVTFVTPEFVKQMPEHNDMLPGVLYVSEKYGLAIHLCACGCGTETVTPIRGSKSWTFSMLNGTVTLHPSIGNQQLPCKSHYWIQANQIVWT